MSKVTRRREHVAWPRHPLTGRQFRVSAATERELAAILHRIDVVRNELRLGMTSAGDVDRSLRRLVRGAVTLQRAGEAYARSGIAKNTARRVRSFLEVTGKALASRELDDLSTEACATWIESLRRTHAPATVRVAWRTLGAIVRYAAEREWVGRVPWGAWRPVVRGDSPAGEREAARSVAELEQILTAARELDTSRETRGLIGDVEAKIACAALLGLRQGELAGLLWTDLEPTRGIVFVRRQADGEPTKTRTVDALIAAPEVWSALRTLRARLLERGLFDADGPVFRVRTCTDRARAYTSGECLSRRDLRAVIQAAHLPEIARWSAHSLRDTFVTLELNARHGDLRTTRLRSRHRSTASLARYLRSTTREIPRPAFSLSSDPPPALPSSSSKK